MIISNPSAQLIKGYLIYWPPFGMMFTVAFDHDPYKLMDAGVVGKHVRLASVILGSASCQLAKKPRHHGVL